MAWLTKQWLRMWGCRTNLEVFRRENDYFFSLYILLTEQAEEKNRIKRKDSLFCPLSCILWTWLAGIKHLATKSIRISSFCTFCHLTFWGPVFRYSFSRAIPIFFNRHKSVFSLSGRYKISTSNWLCIEICENVVLSKIDIAMTTINKILWNW